MKTRDDFKAEAHRQVFDNGIMAWYDDEPRTPPYRDAGYANAWRAGWDQAERRQQELTRIGQKN